MAEVIDIVCGMTVDSESSVSAEYNGETYYFCCDGCKGTFERASEYYIAEFEGESGKQE